MDTETRIRLLEAGLDNTRADLAAANRRVEALEAMCLYFISFADRGAEAPGKATVHLLESTVKQMNRRKDKKNMADLQKLASVLSLMTGLTSPF